MPLPTTFAGDSSRGAGQWTGSYGAAPIGGPYTIQSYQDTATYASTIGPDNRTQSLVVDSLGNVYSTGYVTNGTLAATSIVLNKQSPSGTLTWSVGITGSSSSGFNSISSMKLGIDSSNNIYVMGWLFATGYGANVMKFNSSGTLLWSYILTGSPSPFFNGIAIDSSGNVYLSGNNGGSIPIIAKLNSSGAWQWGYQLNGTMGQLSSGVALDSSGNVNVAAGNTFFQMSSSGSLNWYSYTNSGPQFASVCCDSSKNVYFVGTTGITSRTSSGTWRWGYTYTDGTYGTSLNGSVIDSSNNIYVAGQLAGPGYVGATLKIDSSGNVLNSGCMYSPMQNSQYGASLNDVAFDISGNTYWGGYAQTSQFYTDAKSNKFYYNNSIIVKDTSAFQGTHAGTYTMNSYLSVSWNKSRTLSKASVSSTAITGGGSLTTISSSNWATQTVTTNNALSGGQPGIVAALVTI